MLSLVFCSYLILFPTITYGKFGAILVTLLDLSTIGAPPALPGYLGVSTVIALFNLRDNGILTIKRGKIFIASQVTYCVFDKTGTLTTDNLQKFGILDTSFISSSDEKFKFDKFKSSEKRHSSIFSSSSDINELNEQNLKIIKNFNSTFSFVNPSIEISYLKEECLATCHTLSFINNEPTGDSLETEIFKDIDWELEDLYNSKNGDYKAIANPKQDPSFRVGVIKQFEFSSTLQRMGVITQTLENKDSELFKIYVKGSPEKILTLCKEDSIPSDFSETLSDYTSSGLRVIATACKLIKTNDIGLYTRNQAEKDLVFLGFYIVENKLKNETKEEINALKKAELKICMATGDNILTASYISQQCNIVKSDIITMELNMSTGDVKTGFFENKFDMDNSHHDFYVSDETDITLVDDYNNYEAVKKDEDNIFNNNKNINYVETMGVKPHESQKNFIGGPEDVGNPDKNDENIIITNNQGTNNDNNRSKLCLKYNKVLAVEQFDNADNSINRTEADPDISIISSNSKKSKNSRFSIINDTKYEKEEKEIDPYLLKENDLNDIYSKHFLRDKDMKIQFKIIEFLVKSNFQNSAVYAIDGNLFTTLVQIKKNDFASTEIKSLISHIILDKTKIFARMTPIMKAQLVSEIKEDEDVVLMCGDGANDCAALKCADVGISLSMEEASIASPFTSLKTNISCVQNVIIEGKAAIVTTIHTFKLMCNYSLTVLVGGTILIFKGTYVTVFQYMAYDLLIVLIYVCMIGLIKPSRPLCKEIPDRRLFCSKNISAQAGTLIAFAFFQAYCVSWIQGLDWYVECEVSNPNDPYDYSLKPCYLTTLVFLMIEFQVLVSCFVVPITLPFKKHYTTYPPIVIFLIIQIVYIYELVLNPDWVSVDVYMLKEFPNSYTKTLLFFTLHINFAVCYFMETVFSDFISSLFKKWEFPAKKRLPYYNKQSIA